MHEIRCPGLIYRYNPQTGRKDLQKCESLLCKLTEGSKCEIVCRKCKSKMTIIVRPTYDLKPVIQIRQENLN